MASGTTQKFADGTDSGWIEITNPTVFTGTLQYRKVGNTLYLQTKGPCQVVNSLSAYSYVQLLQGNPIPSDFRPVQSTAGNVLVNTGSFYSSVASLGNDGSVLMVAPAAINSNHSFWISIIALKE